MRYVQKAKRAVHGQIMQTNEDLLLHTACVAFQLKQLRPPPWITVIFTMEMSAQYYLRKVVVPERGQLSQS